jgi:DNA-binding transcriptional regulator GbsR (MarR family)
MDAKSEQFIERMGQLFEAEAGPRIAGRLFGLLLLTPGALSLDEIAETLRVSKASVSANARMLESMHVISRVTRPGDRRDYYEVSEDTQRRLIEVRLERMVRFKEALEQGLETEAAEQDVVRERLRSFWHSFEVITETIRKLRDEGAIPASGSRGDI